MAKKDDKVTQLQQKSRFAAMEGLRSKGGLPEPPRKAMKEAKKLSKKLPYPVPPYGDNSPLQMYRWAQYEWRKLGKWQGLTLPLVILSALLTWERESALREARWEEVERAETKRIAAETYGAYGKQEPKRRKLFGVIPIPFLK